MGGFFYLQWQSWNNTPQEHDSDGISNTIQIGQKENHLFSLSQTFAEQLASHEYSFGEFSETPNFLDFTNIKSPNQAVKIKILKNGLLFFTIFELTLSDDLTYDNLLFSIKNSLKSSDIELMPAIFGPRTFYFSQNMMVTNILPFNQSALGFQFSIENFSEIRRFISALVILN